MTNEPEVPEKYRSGGPQIGPYSGPIEYRSYQSAYSGPIEYRSYQDLDHAHFYSVGRKEQSDTPEKSPEKPRRMLRPVK